MSLFDINPLINEVKKFNQTQLEIVTLLQEQNKLLQQILTK